jgi:putative membrane protein
MSQSESPEVKLSEKKLSASQSKLTSKHVSDHLANERTFLAWIRTGLATITFGFVVARFGLFLRELNLKSITASASTIHYSAVIGISLTVLGVVFMAVALVNFLQIRREIDEERFYPRSRYAVLLTALACLIGATLVVYLFLTS